MNNQAPLAIALGGTRPGEGLASQTARAGVGVGGKEVGGRWVAQR